MKLAFGIFFLVSLVIGTHIYTISQPQGTSLALTDYRAFYTAAQISRSGNFSHLYSLQTQYTEQKKIFPSLKQHDLLPFFYLPPFALLISPLAHLSYTAGYLIIAAILFILFCFCLFVFIHKSKKKPYIFFLSAGFFPVWFSLLYVQWSILWLLVFSFSYLSSTKKKPFLAGIFMSILLLKPHFILIPFLFSFIIDQKKMLLGLIVGSLSILFISTLLIGQSGFIHYIKFLKYLSFSGNIYGLNPSVQPTLKGLLFALFEYKIQPPLIMGIWFLGIIVILFLTFSQLKNHFTDRKYMWTVFLLLFIVSNIHLHYQDLTLLLLPLILYVKSIRAIFANYLHRYKASYLPYPEDFAVFVLSFGISMIWILIPQLATVSIGAALFMVLFHHDSAHLHRRRIKG